MKSVVSTLFLPIQNGVLNERPLSAAFLNAYPHPSLAGLGAEPLFIQQYFKPYATLLQDQGLTVSSEVTQEDASCDLSFMLLPKNMIEARALMAQALKILKPGGQIFCAADNKAGGTRLKKMLQQFGVDNIQELSKNKARVVWGTCSAVDKPVIHQALEEGSTQPVLDGQYVSTPGIFGWDKVDKGSELLSQHIPDTLSGKGADFGCGYGYLSKNIVQKCAGVTEFLCMDADYRAVKCCERNLRSIQTSARLSFFWEDLTEPLVNHLDLDFIIMNPPFHEGKKTDSDIGKAFIDTAFKSLHIGGKLWMVANAQLPYEETLQNRFTNVQMEFEGQGFKVFCAEK